MANPSSIGAAPEAADLSVKPPDNVVIPPKAVRDNVAKTADFVYRRGDAAFHSMRQRVAGDSKSPMTFIMDDDPYYPYFTWYLQQLKEGNGPANLAAKPVADNKPKGPPEPAKFRFSARMPNISAKDLDVLKLTALYTARVGENWLKELRNRESGNAQFEWLRPNHSFFQFFRSLVDQYKILLEEEQTAEARIEELQRNIHNRFHILDRAKQRAEYVKFVHTQKQREEKKAEDEKREYSTIDWHDFSVIATVEFDEVDDNANLPAPALLNDLQSQSLEQKAIVSLSTRRLEEALPDDTTYFNVNQQYTVPPPMQQPMYPIPSAFPNHMAPHPSPHLPPPPHDYRTPAERMREEEQARRQAENEQRARAQAATRGAPGRIVTDYVPRAALKKPNVSTVLCPNCKQNILANEIDEHIRIELLDPRWKEQRNRADARYSTTIYTADVANNLKRFASQREDIYDGVTGMSVSPEEEARRKKAALSYDGQPDAAKDAARVAQMQSMTVQEQLRRIHEKHHQ
ncbi:Pre-mRNA splicing factor PRP21 like protein-domain-containing protein [Phaeosphaeriaceae sp. PMI808]|nr:Pre-mRNA splicing factor PRP21 like protein-domain-containing protein [Phaeosphaeriaceae sp. PMI808]